MGGICLASSSGTASTVTVPTLILSAIRLMRPASLLVDNDLVYILVPGFRLAQDAVGDAVALGLLHKLLHFALRHIENSRGTGLQHLG